MCTRVLPGCWLLRRVNTLGRDAGSGGLGEHTYRGVCLPPKPRDKPSPLGKGVDPRQGVRFKVELPARREASLQRGSWLSQGAEKMVEVHATMALKLRPAKPTRLQCPHCQHPGASHLLARLCLRPPAQHLGHGRAQDTTKKRKQTWGGPAVLNSQGPRPARLLGPEPRPCQGPPVGDAHSSPWARTASAHFPLPAS